LTGSEAVLIDLVREYLALYLSLMSKD